MRNKIFNIVLLSLIISGCSAMLLRFKNKVDYNFQKPLKIITLPSILHEISGITALTEHTLACIQDENGIVFIYDTRNEEIEHQYSFYLDGDYEGISRVEDRLYILRSDGNLFEVKHFDVDTFKLVEYRTGIPANNNEGLCYDKRNHRLLIACKSNLGKGPEFKDKRVIYGFDLITKQLSQNPVFEFSLDEIKSKAQKIGIEKQNSKKRKKQDSPEIKFRISAIGIHPLTQQLFVLSAVDHMLFVFDAHGNVEHIQDLNPKLFNKAEGIAFLKNGDVMITNEGQDHKPTLLTFKYKPH